jgi:hypothetical protein
MLENAKERKKCSRKKREERNAVKENQKRERRRKIRKTGKEGKAMKEKMKAKREYYANSVYIFIIRLEFRKM